MREACILSLHRADEREAEGSASCIDAALIFGALCEFVQGEQQHDDAPARSALELVQRLVGACGPGFRSECFVGLIRGPLLSALLRSCVSPVLSLFQAGLAVFVALCLQLKGQFKKEIGVLFTRVVLKVLESANSTFEQRMLVLQSLLKISAKGQLLVELFVNYDCGRTTPRVFGPLLEALSRVVQAEHKEADWLSPKQELLMKTLGLQVLVTVLRSMVQWMRRTGRPVRTLSESQVGTDGGSEAGSEVAEPSDVERRRRERERIEEIVTAFNLKPKRGVDALSASSGADVGPLEVARFLAEAPGLDRAQVGEFLGDPADFNVTVLEQYCLTEPLRGMPLDAATRQFLTRFTLPKEGQKIERIMEQFSAAWHSQNSAGPVRSAEAVFLLAVGIVMLNTDLHNPQVEHKMKIEAWISQFRGGNEGQDFPEDLLASIYHRVQERPMKDLHTAVALDKAGKYAMNITQLFAKKKDLKT
eukprot:Hpha_TRINITY_DN3628_c0_g2::TRINITY_DN3628_c0_g2_i1::g.1031::m.1031/K18442/ARFGEF, BIG; brefeldin A-inhibited guanine nucleotide-exchange protein